MDRANALDEFRRQRRLQDAAMDTDLQGLRNELLFEKVGEEQDLRLGALGANSGEHFKPTQLGHPQIQQQDVRLEGFHPTQHLAAIRGFADDLVGSKNSNLPLYQRLRTNNRFLWVH
jgi:hypothetical protein